MRALAGPVGLNGGGHPSSTPRCRTRVTENGQRTWMCGPASPSRSKCGARVADGDEGVAVGGEGAQDLGGAAATDVGWMSCSRTTSLRFTLLMTAWATRVASRYFQSSVSRVHSTGERVVAPRTVLLMAP